MRSQGAKHLERSMGTLSGGLVVTNAGDGTITSVRDSEESNHLNVHIASLELSIQYYTCNLERLYCVSLESCLHSIC